MGPFGIYFKAQSFFFILINVAICQTINKCDDTPFIGGNCEQSQLRWSYSQKLSRCKPFSFSGCGGNTNNFNSKQECLKSKLHNMKTGVVSKMESLKPGFTPF
jgi:hypothetical protein